MKKMLAVALLGTLPLMASMCGGGTEAPQPPPCPANPPAPVRQDGELVRFEYGITDLEGRPKNCFRQGEEFRLYLYVINKTETMLHWPAVGNNTPIITNLSDTDKLKINLNGPQCRLGGHHINAFDTMIFEMPLKWDLAVKGGLSPYPDYHAKRFCGYANWSINQQFQRLHEGMQMAKIDVSLPIIVSTPLVAPLYQAPLLSSYTVHSFQAEIPFTIQ